MYKLWSILIALILVTEGYAGSSINMLEYGPKTYDTITNVTTQVGTNRAVELIFDGGAWTLTNNVTFSDNLFLRFIPGTTFAINSNNVVTINGKIDNTWALKFTDDTGATVGATSVAMAYTNLVYIPAWFGNTNDALRRYQPAPDMSLYPTLAGDNVFYGTNTVGALIFTEPGTSTVMATVSRAVSDPDYRKTFMGFPKIQLTTNMCSYSYATGGALVPTNWANAFDNDRTTKTPSQGGADAYGVQFIDFGANYHGWVVIVVDAYVSAGNILWNHGVSYSNYVSSSVNNLNAQNLNYVGTQRRVIIFPFEGRYYSSYFGYGSAGTHYLYYCDFSVYGHTNGFQNMGGMY